MNKKLLILMILVFGIYLAIYVTSEVILHRKNIPIDSSPHVIFISPTCPPYEHTILILQNGQSVCHTENSLYIVHMNKKKTLLEAEKDDIFFPSSPNIVVRSRKNIITVLRITETLSVFELISFELPTDITPVALFSVSQDVNTLYLYLSTEHIAKRAKDEKGRIYEIAMYQPRGESPPRIKEFPSIEMLKVADAFPSSQLVILRELYPFLVPKIRVLRWKETAELLALTCSPNVLVPSSPHAIFATAECDKITRGQFLSVQPDTLTLSGLGFLNFPLAVVNTSYLYLNSENAQLCVTNNTSNEIECMNFSEHTEAWEIVAKYSTTIGKKVYNCFDFSESLQITLRTCIPVL